jgi:putative hydrolase of the HAD superfamily
MMNTPAWIAFDADDTLWVNEPYFFEAEKALEELLAPYTDLRGPAFTEALYQTEKRNLSLFGYGAKGFTLSMIETAIELSKGRVSGVEIQQIIDQGKQVMHYPIELLDGVMEVLTALHGRFPLMVITKGDLFNQESKLARSGLAPFFDQVEIVSEKEPETYRAIMEKYKLRAEEGLMIGNSLKSDILPAIEVGMQAIHVRQEVNWVHEEVEPEGEPKWETLENLRELVPLLKA